MLNTAEIVPALASDFPDYEFRSVLTWGGLAIMASRRAGVRVQGLYVIITSDMTELRRELSGASS
jgi:hypothetical protein